MNYPDNVKALAEKRGVLCSGRGLYEPQLGIKDLVLRSEGSQEPTRFPRDDWNRDIRLFVEDQAATRCDLGDLTIKGDGFKAMLADAEVFFADHWATDMHDDLSRFMKRLKESGSLEIVPKR